ncbi:uncharacterized protein LOC134191364 isoform X2 [Corticium candelabrum]|uniref:uncharacterized protein LOC134191364 isoform X2 n=1 Tax=Corticium candelabrum TaxID=121492 RepID=UPI002E26772E|nr:uncharacterized protein LOC134191364 isoform X2 [Corticium candelabrum]
MLPDCKSPFCRHCGEEFTWLKRRHHCRYCGGSYHDSWVCGGSSAPFITCLGKRTCRNCKVLFKNYNLLLQGAQFILWIGVDREECFVHISPQEGVFVLTWQITHTRTPDSTLSFVDVDIGNIHKFTQEATPTTPRQLLIRIDGKGKSVVLETTNESLLERWFDVCNAACIVSHIVAERNERVQERLQSEDEEEHRRIMESNRQRWAETRNAMRAKHNL